MVYDHWNPPRVAIVLLHNGKLRLSKNVTEASWRFPEAVMMLRDKDALVSAKRIMREQFSADLFTEGILAVRLQEVGDHVGAVTTYVLARTTDERTNPLPGLQLNIVPIHRMKELSSDHQLCYDVLPLYDLAQAWIKKEQR